MTLVLTSDFPSTPTSEVVALLHERTPAPRIALIPPFTDLRREKFDATRERFAAFGCPDLDYVDIDEEVNERQLAQLPGYDVVYLSGGDPIRFDRNVRRSGLAEHLRAAVAAGTLVMGASGGCLQLTKNLSLYRLVAFTVDQVIAERGQYEGLGVVDYEILPHLNRFDADFLGKVRQYSERIDNDVVALEDGAAVIEATGRTVRVIGRVVAFRKGIASPFDPASSQDPHATPGSCA